MIVTDLEYHLESRLVKKLDLMVHRVTNKSLRKDAILIVEGGEGEGKTNTSEALAYYFKYHTGRDIHMFFHLDSMIEFAKSTEKKIIIWDEPALDSLATDWYKQTSINLIRLLMTCRKKRHVFIFNYVKFYKFPEYLVVDRPLCLIHMYSRHGVIPGRFLYLKKSALEHLYRVYRSQKIRAYNKFKYFGGNFPKVEHLLPQMGITVEGTPNVTLEQYEKIKDEAILTIGSKKISPVRSELKELKRKISKLTMPIKTKRELAFKLEMTPRAVRTWGEPELPNKKPKYA